MTETQNFMIPDGWISAPLKSVSKKLVDGSHNPPSKKETGLPMLSARNIENGVINWDENYRLISEDDFESEDKRTQIAPDDVLLTIVGTIGRTCVVPKISQKFTLQRSVAVIKPKNIEPKFLCYQLQSHRIQHHLIKNAKGTAQKGIYLKELGLTEILIAPPEQQKRIVAKIEELFSHIDAGIDALKKAKQRLKQYRQSVLKAAVTGELTKEWRDANKDKLEPASKLLERILKERRQKWEEQQIEEFKAKGKVPKDEKWKEKYEEPLESELHDLPTLCGNWIYVRLDALTEIQGGLTVDSKRERAGTTRIPYLRVANVQRGYLDLSEMKEIAVPEERLKGLLLQDGDILFNEGGDRDKLGRGWVWRNEVNPCTYQNHVFRARPYTNKIIPEFISIFGNTFGQDYFMKQGKQTTNLASINKTKLSAFPVPLCSRKEANEIMAMLDSKITNIDRLNKNIERQLLKADKNKQSILSSAFRGSLVGRLETDGDASELLEQIKGDRPTPTLTTKKEYKRNPRTRKNEVDMPRRDIIEILKSEKKPLSTEALFLLTGLDGSSPDHVEDFYLELKKAISDKNIVTLEIEVDGVKQGNSFHYKASK